MCIVHASPSRSLKLDRYVCAAAFHSNNLEFRISMRTRVRVRSGVFVARCPLAGLTGVARRLNLVSLKPVPSHWMVMIKDSSDESLVVIDFLPEEPLAVHTAASLLSGGSVPGVHLLLVCPATAKPQHIGRMHGCFHPHAKRSIPRSMVSAV